MSNYTPKFYFRVAAATALLAGAMIVTAGFGILGGLGMVGIAASAPILPIVAAAGVGLLPLAGFSLAVGASLSSPISRSPK